MRRRGGGGRPGRTGGGGEEVEGRSGGGSLRREEIWCSGRRWRNGRGTGSSLGQWWRREGKISGEEGPMVEEGEERTGKRRSLGGERWGPALAAGSGRGGDEGGERRRKKVGRKVLRGRAGARSCSGAGARGRGEWKKKK